MSPGSSPNATRRGVHSAVVFTDGFTEIGAEGAAMEAELAEVVKRGSVRVIGPNTNDNAFEIFPAPANHRGRKIAMMTQSGANGRSVVEGVVMGAAFERWITTGNEVDLEVADFINYFAGLDSVGVIALYVEGFKDPAKLRVALERALQLGKPVVAIKMGSTEKGAKAAASHTGHLTGADAVVNGIFRQYGVTRVDDLDELLETANLFSKLPEGTGTRCAAYTMSGGTAALMAEAADKAGVELPLFDQALQDTLHTYIQPNLNVANPVDNGGVFIMTATPDQRREVLDLIAANPHIDILLMGLNAAYGPVSDRIAADTLAWAPTGNKAMVAIWTSVQTDTQGYRDLVESGVTIFRSFNKCMRAIGAYRRYQARHATFVAPQLESRMPSAALSSALAKAGVVEAGAASAMLRDAGIDLAGEALASTADEAARIASEFGFPVVMKLMSPAFPHKTDLGLVRLNIASVDEAREAAQALLARAKGLDPLAPIDGVLVQEQIGKGVEMIIGLSQDTQFGPTLTIGAGGIYAEVLKDVAVAPLPVSEADVREMIASLRLAPLLDGVRGAPAGDKEAFVAMAMKVAALGESAGAKLAELDLNPVMVLPDRAVAVDSLAVAG